MSSTYTVFAQNILYRQIEALLLAHPLVDDCVVLARGADSTQIATAYIVSAETISTEQLQTHLAAQFPSVQLTFVFVACLPLTEQGQIDLQALLALETIDAELIQRWEQELQLLSDIERVAVVAQPVNHSTPPLHLSDLFDTWQPPAEFAKQPSVLTQPSLPNGPPAITQGEPLLEPDMTLATVLQRSLAAGKGILYLQMDGREVYQSYQALLAEAEQILAGLRQLGLQPQDKIIFQCDRNQDFIPAFWACMLGGFVAVPVAVAPTYEAAHSAIRKLHHVWELLEQPLILTRSALAPVLQELLSSEETACRIAEIDDLRRNAPDPTWYIGKATDLALLIFTSGSTGIPKGVMLTQKNILSSVAASAQMNGMTSQDVTLNWLNLDHVGSLIRCCIRDVYTGCQQIHAPAQVILENPLRWLDWIAQYRVTHAWAPNFALALVNAQAAAIQQRQWDLSSVRSLLSVAEPISPQTAVRLVQLLAPHGFTAEAMHSAWGMSETGAAVTFSYTYLDRLSITAPFVEVGRPIPGFAMRIVDDADQPLPEGIAGRLQIRGAMITAGYYQNPELNATAFTADGWLKTGDLGLIRDGCLTVTGREKDVIIINGLNHYSHEIEAIVEQVAGVAASYTAACAVRLTQSETDQLAIFFHAPGGYTAELLKQIRQTVAERLQISPTYLIPLPKDEIPKTSIGKLQRAQLKQRLEAGELAPILKQVDILIANANTIPDWFYQKIWCRREAVTLGPKPAGQTIVFLDSLGLGQQLCSELANCIQVRAGTAFTQSGHVYSIDPQNPDHYRQLLQSIAQAGQPIHQILHLWTYGSRNEITCAADLEAAQQQAYHFLSLVQAITSELPQHLLRLLVISNHAQPVLAQDLIAYEKAPLLGLLKTIARELPWLDCRHLDFDLAFDLADAEPVGIAQQVLMHVPAVLQEICVLQKQPEVAYRNGQRWIPKLQQAELAQTNQPIRLHRGGFYLLSGGLGEIAVEIARYLLHHYEVHLLLVGRTPLPVAENLPPDIERRLRDYRSLQQLPGEVMYAAVDICNLPQLQQIVTEVGQQWQRQLDGVIHLARMTEERLLTAETPDSFAAILRPKTIGTWTLHQLIKDKPESLFVHFSSIASFFGAVQIGTYAAANRFVEAFSHHQRCQGLQSYCFAWSIWEDVGNNRSYQMRALARLRGYHTILSEQGIQSFLAGLRQQPSELIIGLDGSNAYLRPYIQTALLPVQQLCAYFTAAAPLDLSDLQNRSLPDRFGVRSQCQFLQQQSLPLTATGAIDRQRLCGGMIEIAPRTDTERRVAAIWQDLLPVSDLSVQANFFECGGTSLLAMQMFAQIEAEFGQRLPLSTLFQAATIEQLAEVLQQDEPNHWTSLVPIQPYGSKPPLFAIHEVYGEVLFYRELSEYLGSDQPFYGLQPQILNGERPCHTEIKDMAAHYIAEIRRVQPQGPYHLTGYSLGGLIAFEMAQQLLQHEQQVGLLVLLDTRSLEFIAGFSYYNPLPRYRKLLLHLKNLLLLPWSEKQAYLSRRNRRDNPVADPIQEMLSQSFTKEMRQMIVAVNRQAVQRYTPQPYPGCLTLFFAEQEDTQEDMDFCEYYNFDLGWRRLAGHFQFHSFPCEHHTMLTQPHVQQIAAQMQTCLMLAQTCSSQAGFQDSGK